MKIITFIVLLFSAMLFTQCDSPKKGLEQMTTDRKLEGYRGQLNKECITIAEAMKTAGYSTYMSGKWHVTPYRSENYSKDNWPLQRGFDRFYGTIHGAGSFYDPNGLTRDNEYISPYNDPEYCPETFYYTDAISDHATRYIREHNADNPFFMYVAYTAAHWPKGIKEKNKWRNTPGHLVDIMATCIDVGKVSYPSEFNGHQIIPLEGKSLIPVFDRDEIDDRMIFFEHLRNRAVRAGNWKLVAKGLEGPWKLYNMEAWEAWAIRAHVKPFPESRKKN